jgi:hypothetical protein
MDCCKNAARDGVRVLALWPGSAARLTFTVLVFALFVALGGVGVAATGPSSPRSPSAGRRCVAVLNRELHPRPLLR